MAKRYGYGNPTLKVTNFGPIVGAEIDLRPLTVFVGASNTGKSYLATLIYALHRHYGRRRFRPGYSYFRPFLHSNAQRPTLEAREQKEVKEFIKGLAYEKQNGSRPQEIVLTKSIADHVCARLESRKIPLRQELLRCFGFDSTSYLIRKGRKNNAQVAFSDFNGGKSESVTHRLTLVSSKTELQVRLPDNVRIRMPVREEGGFGDALLGIARELNTRKGVRSNRRGMDEAEILEVLIAYLGDQIIRPLARSAFYLPAYRTGVMHAHNVVVNSLIENAAMAGLRPTSGMPVLSGVMADFLEQLIEIGGMRTRRAGSRLSLGKQIESAILGGTVGINHLESVNYPHFYYTPTGWDEGLPLINVSSMVSELAPVVLYLRYFVREGDILIIEEPESHLHPAMQVEFARQLSALVKAGIRVIVTTHSDWLLEELANVVRRSMIPEGYRNQSESGQFALSPEQVGVWLFQRRLRPKGSIAKEIILNDAGLYPSGFDEVGIELHNQWAHLENRIPRAE